jgi:hypothetical protein
MGAIAILALALGLAQTPEGTLVLGVSILLLPIVVNLVSDVKSRASARRPVTLLLEGTFGLGVFSTLCLIMGLPGSVGLVSVGFFTFLAAAYLLVCYGLLWVRLVTLPAAVPCRSRARAVGTVVLLIAGTVLPFALGCLLNLGALVRLFNLEPP